MKEEFSVNSIQKFFLMIWLITALLCGCAQDGQDGQNGQNGLPGIAGPQGQTGATGAQGPQGSTGPQGPAGQNGQNGQNVQVSTTVSFQRQTVTQSQTFSPSNPPSNGKIVFPDHIRITTNRQGLLAERFVLRTRTFQTPGSQNFQVGVINTDAFDTLTLIDNSSGNIIGTAAAQTSQVVPNEVKWQFINLDLSTVIDIRVELTLDPTKTLAFGESSIELLMNFEDQLNVNDPFSFDTNGRPELQGGSIELADIDPNSGASRMVPISDIVGEDDSGLLGPRFVLGRTNFNFPNIVTITENTTPVSLIVNTPLLLHTVEITNNSSDPVNIESLSYQRIQDSGVSTTTSNLKSGTMIIATPSNGSQLDPQFSAQFPSTSLIVIAPQSTLTLSLEVTFGFVGSAEYQLQLNSLVVNKLNKTGQLERFFPLFNVINGPLHTSPPSIFLHDIGSFSTQITNTSQTVMQFHIDNNNSNTVQVDAIAFQTFGDFANLPEVRNNQFQVFFNGNPVALVNEDTLGGGMLDSSDGTVLRFNSPVFISGFNNGTFQVVYDTNSMGTSSPGMSFQCAVIDVEASVNGQQVIVTPAPYFGAILNN